MILISFWARHTKRTQKWTMAALTLDLNFPFDALVQVDESFDSKWFSFWFLYCFQLFLCRCALSPSFPGIPGRLGSRSLYRPQVPNINQPLFSKTKNINQPFFSKTKNINQPSDGDCQPITVFLNRRTSRFYFDFCLHCLFFGLSPQFRSGDLRRVLHPQDSQVLLKRNLNLLFDVVEL